MYRWYFPPCPVDGPVEPPVPFGHMSFRGAVPRKCSECRHLFEGSCTRYSEDIGHYLHLDYGPCGITGPTDPVIYDDEFIASNVEIPRKCNNCVFLNVDRIFGFHCKKDVSKWGDFHRGLDWGSWQPECIFLQLPPPKVTSKQLSQFANRDDLLSFIKEYRRINPDLSHEEAKADFAHFRDVLTRYGKKLDQV